MERVTQEWETVSHVTPIMVSSEAYTNYTRKWQVVQYLYACQTNVGLILVNPELKSPVIGQVLDEVLGPEKRRDKEMLKQGAEQERGAPPSLCKRLHLM